jgi:hypothetical protein
MSVDDQNGIELAQVSLALTLFLSIYGVAFFVLLNTRVHIFYC